MICLKRSTAVILTLIFIMSCGIVHAVDETSATYTFSADKTGGIDPAGTVVGSWGTGYETVAGKFGRNSDDYSLEASLAANNTHGVDMRLGNNTLNIANNIINIKISMAYPSDEQFTKLSIMPAVNVTEAAKDAYKGSKNIDGFLTIAGDGALTFAGVSTGTTVEPDRFYAFDIYVNRITKACSLFVNGEAVTGTFTVGAGKSGVGFNYGGKIISKFTFDSLKGVQILKTPVSETTNDKRHFYIDDVYMKSGNDLEPKAECSLAARIANIGKGIDASGNIVVLSEAVKNEITTNKTADSKVWTNVIAALGDKFDPETENLEINTYNGNEILILSNSDGTKYFYDVKAVKDKAYNYDENMTDNMAPSWQGSAATTVASVYGKSDTDKAFKIYYGDSNNTYNTQISGRVGATTAGASLLSITGSMLNLKFALGIPSDKAFEAVKVEPMFNFAWGTNGSGSQCIHNFINVNGDGSLVFCGKTISGVKIDTGRFVAFDCYINTSTKTADLFVDGVKVATNGNVGNGTSTSDCAYFTWGSNQYKYTINKLESVYFLKTYANNEEKTNQVLYVDDVYVAGGTIAVPENDDLASRVKDGNGIYRDPSTGAILIADSIGKDASKIANAIELADGETFTASAMTGRAVLTKANGVRYYYDLDNFVYSDENYYIYDADFNADTAFYVMSEDGGLWRTYSGKKSDGSNVNSSVSATNSFAVTTAAGKYGKDNKTFNIFFVESSSVSGAKTSNMGASEIKETYVRKAYTTKDTYAYLANTVSDMGYDKFVIEFSFMAEDYNTEHKFNINNMVQNGQLRAAETFIKFDKDGNYGLVPNNGGYGKPLGKYELNKWYRISAVFTKNSAAWELYIDGNKISGVPNLTKEFILPVPENDADTRLNGIFELISIPTGNKVEEIATSNMFLDDMAFYFTKSYTPASASNLTVNDYDVKKDNVYLGDAAVTPAVFMESASSEGNTLKLYNNSFEEVAASSTDAMADNHYLIVESADKKTLHRYTLIPGAKDYTDVAANAAVTIPTAGKYVFEVGATDSSKGETLVIASYDGTVLKNCEIYNNVAKDSVIEADLAAGSVKLFVWDMETLKPFDGSFYMTAPVQ